MIGTTVSHYEILGKLGEGGMGIVYKARDAKLNRTVALKFLRPHIANDSTARDRFLNEARAAASLNHPNIATIYSIEDHGNEPYIVMEYVDGMELQAFAKKSPFDVARVCGLVEQIALGLQAAHEQGIIHRDIKSTNVLVSRTGQAKITDFGLAKLSIERSITREGIPIGTVDYMSPEQVRGIDIDHRTDIWSLGVIFYELLDGRLPFRGENEHAVIYSILNENPEPLFFRDCDLSAICNDHFHYSLAKFRDQRFPDVPAFLVKLKAIKNHLGRQAEPEASPALHIDSNGAGLYRSNGSSGRDVAGAATASGRSDSKTETHHPRQQRPLVGREEETEEIIRAWQQVTLGEGLMLGIVGEAGIGKTSLVDNFLDRLPATAGPCFFAKGRCSERLAGKEAYLPILEILRDLLSNPTPMVAELLRSRAPTWYFRAAPPESVFDRKENRSEIEKPVTQEQAKLEIATFFQELTRQRPVILFLDDLQWSDISTIDLLLYLAGKFSDTRLLIVIAFRPTDMILAEQPFLQSRPDLLARGEYREISLDFLNQQNISDYLNAAFPENDFDSAFHNFIYAKTEGNPLFVVELIRYFRARGVIERSANRWLVSQSRNFEEIEHELPESISALIERQINRLNEPERQLLTAAAVQGSDFDTAIVARALAMDESLVQERLQSIEQQHALVQQIEECELPDHSLTVQYRFVHILYQNAIYRNLAPSRRISMSRAIAESLLSCYGEKRNRMATQLALLFESAREFMSAAEFFLVAAKNAVRVFACREAIELGLRGLNALHKAGGSSESLQLELEFQLVLGPAYSATKGFGARQVSKAYGRAREICHQIGQKQKLLPALFGTWAFYLLRAEYQTSLNMANQIEQLAQDRDDPTIRMISHYTQGLSSFYRGNFSNALDNLLAAHSLYDVRQHRQLSPWMGGSDVGVSTLGHLARTMWILGYPDQARKRASEGMKLAQEIEHPFSYAFSLVFATNVAISRGDITGASRHTKENLAHSAKHGFSHMVAHSEFHRGWVQAMQGQVEDGTQAMREGLHGWHASGMKLGLPNWLAWSSEVYLKYHQHGEAMKQIDEALRLCTTTGENFWKAELYRLKGASLAARGDSAAEAEANIQKAVEISRQQQARSFELRSVMSLCRLEQNHHGADAARDQLYEIMCRFDEGFETTDLKEAHAILSELSGPDPAV